MQFFYKISLLMSMLLWGQSPSCGQDPSIPTLKARAADAKARGEKQIFTRIISSENLGETFHLTELAKDYSVLLVEPLSVKTEVTNTTIFTWYTLRILLVVSQPAHCIDCDETATVPSFIKLTHKNDIAVRFLGGKAKVDGVQVTVGNPGAPDFHLGHHYLVLASISKSKSVITRIMPGQAAVAEVSKDGKFVFRDSSGDVLQKDFEKLQTIQNVTSSIKASAKKSEK